MRTLLFIALGSGIGGAARHWLSVLLAMRFGEVFPWGTLVVNVVGSAAIGLLAGLADAGRLGLAEDTRLFLMVGVMGGFTTFSTFSLQTLRLLHEGDWMRVSANVAASVAMCLIAVALGYRIARLLG